ncbi:FHA domain-containing protein [Clostridium tetani]|uniref:FHA domain-containing protein n=1 Tax=Clostridium tetani TaxID=1513 RepID=UPI00100A7D47|nr:FHA domain-containing protein [Clostridium tetani]RXI45592.1 FHA domain-containing protein [Clostridium tetani]RXM60586.1 FHA domain-containing protein [Clostridium tetani]RXM67995.1 FHA domain-containing protein [Clostridium tetani]
MLLNKISSVITIIMIAIIYLIIFTALRIMNKDIKSGNKGKRDRRKVVGFEILEPGNNSSFKKGGVIPLRRELSIGRNAQNTFIIDDPYISSFHVRIYLRNNDYIIEDLGSTNGTIVNNTKINGKKYLESGDVVKLGSTVLKFID